MDASKRAMQRVNGRVAGLAIAGMVAGVAIWQSIAVTRKPPAGPTRQVATGVDPSLPATGGVQPAVASLSDEQLPSSGNYRLMQYGQPADSPGGTPQPPTSPYLPTNNDAAGGYSSNRTTNSRFSAAALQFGQSGDAAQAAAVPSDPTGGQQPATVPVPEGGSAPAYVPLSQSPYAAAAANSAGGYGSSVNNSPPATAPVADLTPVPDAAAANSNRFGGSGAAYGQSTAGVPVPRPQSSSVPPPNNLAPAELNVGAGGLSPYRSAVSPPNPLPKGDAVGKLAAAMPGERTFEGPQQPSISLEKVSPSEIQVGKPATFGLYVRNAGQVAAQNVVVTDHVPAGTQLLEARPQPQQAADGSLVWSLGTIQPGD
ncbi:MAG TPA: hypothetical protein VKH44_03880, partial [Pirellulaceae bacterium]|nr:hypothetical protein [Pirellulaceae bacterium]